VRPPTIAVLDYGIGNLRSAQKALERVGADARLTTDPGVVRDADGVVLPGVGAFGRCMEALRAAGLDTVAHDTIESGRPFLGICVGMQMLFDASEESPGARGLGVVPGTVRWLPAHVKRPQMQWNRLHLVRTSPLFDGLGPDPWMYFVHSFHPVPLDPDVITATTDYGGPVVATVERANVTAVQFHPEKSARAGLALLSNWASALVPA
jgi:glutamine amidotransferase